MRSLFLVTLTLLSTGVFAQSIENEFNRYITALNNLSNTRSTDELKPFLWDSYTLESTDVSLLGKISTRKITKDQFVKGIENFLTYKDVNYKLIVEDVNVIHQDSLKADLTSEQKLMVYLGDKHIETRELQTHLYYKKFRGEWKLVHNVQISTIEERKAGRCPCTIYANNDVYLSETFIPTGFQYKRMFDKFRFSKDAERTIIDYKGTLYYHMPNNDLLNAEKVKIGSVASRDEAIHFILGMEYKQTCLRFK